MCATPTKIPMATAEACLTWLSKAFSEQDGTPSSRRILFALTVAFVLGLVTGALCTQKMLSPEAVDLLKTTLYVTGGVLAVGKFAEAKV